MISIGTRLKQLRKQANMTQQEISQLLGFSKNTYAHYEHDRSRPSIQNFVKLAEIFHTSIHYIVTGCDFKQQFQDTNTVCFPQQLRHLREANNMTQAKLAELLKIEEVTYQQYEYGTFEPKLDKLQILVELFDVSYDELMGRNKKQGNKQ